MIFEKRFHPKVKNDLKKIDKKVVQEIREIHLEKIAQDPYLYPSLKGKLARFHSYHFAKNRVEYRIIYKIIDEEVVVLFMMIAKRENVYENLSKRVR